MLVCSERAAYIKKRKVGLAHSSVHSQPIHAAWHILGRQLCHPAGRAVVVKTESLTRGLDVMPRRADQTDPAGRA